MTALDLLHGLVLDDGRRWGEIATEWQRDDAAAVLEPGDGPAFNWLSRPKGGSKSTDVGGLVTAWLVEQAPALSVAYVVSADLDQSNRLLDRIRGIVHRTPALKQVLKVEARRIVHVGSGARVEALPADVAGSEGLLTPLIVLEELPNWQGSRAAKGMLTAALSSLPKWPGARLVVIGHAGDPAHFSYKLLQHARVSVEWRVNEIAGPLPWMSGAALAEQQALLLPSEFARRHLNVWTAGEDRLSDVDDLRACAVLDGPAEHNGRHSYVVAVDLGVKNDRTVAVVAHAETLAAGSVVFVDRIAVWAPQRGLPVDLDEVEAWIAAAAASYHAPVVYDPWQAVGMAQRLSKSGAATIEFAFSAQSVARLALTLHGLIKSRQLRIPADDAELFDELANVRLRESSPGVYRMDHDSGRHDDRAIALALAAHHLVGGGYASFDASALLALHSQGRRGGVMSDVLELDATIDRSGEALWDDDPSHVAALRRRENIATRAF